jgi:Nif-specific regulatory protein
MRHGWPGNVRELENCIERAVLMTADNTIRAEHLPPTVHAGRVEGSAAGGTLPAVLDNVEREMILDALRASGGNMAQAARDLGITERVMGLRVKKYDINPRQFRR